MDQRKQRDGRVIEQLGWYDPITKDAAKQIKINEERVRYWISQGAQPTQTVGNLLKRHGIET